MKVYEMLKSDDLEMRSLGLVALSGLNGKDFVDFLDFFFTLKSTELPKVSRARIAFKISVTKF